MLPSYRIELTPQEEQPQLLQPEELQQLEQEQEGMLIAEKG
jgi:hypothetical protein